jgi:ATP-dependent RNA helicase DeaD
VCEKGARYVLVGVNRYSEWIKEKNKLTTFQELGISQSILSSVSKMGFEEATPIQAETIPLALEGHDLIGQAQTGTGKTAAFGIPMIEKFDKNNNAIQGLVIAPTRELAIQVSEELHRIGRSSGVSTLPIYGGQDIGRQIRSLKRQPNIVVGTPGRLLDHINRKTIRLDQIKMIVLDEADEMLNMGFIEDIESILKAVPEERQSLLFSATMPGPIQKIAERFMNNPKIVRVKAKEVTVPSIEQQYYEVHEQKKFDLITRLLDIQAPELAIVFGRTKRRVDELSEALSIRGYAAEGIHGDLSQAKRMSVLRQFKSNSIDILVATDVAARGLDISGVTHVYNFDLPQDPESYVHRIGRTGRAGKTGVAMTFVTPREIQHLKAIEKTTKRKMDRKEMPSLDEAMAGMQRMSVESLVNTIKNENISSYRGWAEELLENHDSVTVIAAALKLLTKEPDNTPVKLTAESPLPTKKNSGGGRNHKSSKGRYNGKRGGWNDSNRKGGSGRGGNRRKSRNYNDKNSNRNNDYKKNER